MDEELKQYLDAMDLRTDGRLQRLDEHLTEKMRDMQTELLRGFASFSQNQTIRLRKVEVDQSNLQRYRVG
jgi:hypothetical protein